MKNPTKKEIEKLIDKKKNEEEKQKEYERNIKDKVVKILETKKSNDKKAIKVKLNSQGIKKVVAKFANKINSMLNENIQESIEFGTKNVGNTKVDYGLRMKFLDDKEDEENKVKWIKRKRRKD